MTERKNGMLGAKIARSEFIGEVQRVNVSLVEKWVELYEQQGRPERGIHATLPRWSSRARREEDGASR